MMYHGKRIPLPLFGRCQVFIFTVVGFLQFNDRYSFDGHRGCHQLLQCFLMHLDYGLAIAPTFDLYKDEMPAWGWVDVMNLSFVFF